jgi:HK97 family phage portal protein
MRWPWRNEAKSTFRTISEGGLVQAGLPPFAASLMLSGSEADARRSSTVMAIVNWAMTQGSEPALNVERKNADGEWEVVSGHPAAAIIRRPDPENAKVSWAQLMQVFMESLTIGGNSYAYKLRSPSGRLLGLTAVRGTSIAPREEGGRLVAYQISLTQGRTFLAPPEDVLHVMDGQDIQNPYLGRCRLKEIAHPTATDREIAAFSLALTKSPAPSLLVSAKETGMMQPDQVDALKKRLVENSSGNRAGAAVASSIPLDVQKIGYSPDEMVLDRLQAMSDAKICAVFGIPAMVIGVQVGLERSTFSNYEEARRAALEDFLIPKWRLFEDALTMQLGTEFWGDDPNYRFAFDLDNLRALSENMDAIYKRATDSFIANAIDRATWKTEVGMKPMPEDAGVYSYMLKGTDMQTLMAGVVAGKRADVPG